MLPGHGLFDSDAAEPSALNLAHDPQDTSQLVEDLREFLTNPDYEQAVHDAVAAAGVPERLNLRSSTEPQLLLPPLAAQQKKTRTTAGTFSSAQSTITFNTTLSDQVHDSSSAKATTATGAGDLGTSSAGANQKRMSSELKHEVESLLQRTDSILSRSSGHSTLHGATAGLLPGLIINTAGSIPHGYNQTQDLGGFDFETGSQALETPTFSKSGSREQGNSFTRRLTGEGARRRTFTPGGVDSTTTTGRLSNSSLTPPIGSSSNGMGLPVPDFVGQLGIAQEEGGVGGYGAGSAGGRQVTSLASRLSQQALSEIKDRLDGPEAVSRFSSGYSGADQTTVVLEKSASWRQRALGNLKSGNKSSRTLGEGSGAAGSPIYANFAPLEQLVDAALTESGGSGPGSIRGGQFGGQMGGGAAAAGGGMSRERGVSGALSRAASTHISHKVALGYMLQPDYIHNTTLSRLKSELQGLSKAPPSGVLGSSPFDVKLLALTARLSQWAQQERTAGETFQQMLDSILDTVFARLSPSRGRVPPPPKTAATATPQPTFQQQQLAAPAAAAAPAVKHQPGASLQASRFGSTGHIAATPSAAAARFGSSGSNGTGGSDSSSSMAAAAADAAQRLSQAGTRRATRTDGSSFTAAGAAAEGPKPTDSMLRAAFVKLALGQAKLRQAVVGGPPPAAAAPALPPAGGDVSAAAAPAPTVGALLAAQPDIGVAQRFSICSTGSTPSSRQQSHIGALLDAAAVQQIQAAMQAAAAAAAAGGSPVAAAGVGGGSTAVGSMGLGAAAGVNTSSRASNRQSVALQHGSTHPYRSNASTAAAIVRPSVAAAPAATAASAAKRHSPGRDSAVHCSTDVHGSSDAARRCQSAHCSCSSHCVQQQQAQQWGSPTSCAQCSPHQQQQQQQWCAHPCSSSTQISPQKSQPWLQPQEQRPNNSWPQQQQQQQQDMRHSWDVSCMRSAAATVQKDAWPTSRPSRYSSGRDTLALARQAHKQRTAAQAVQGEHAIQTLQAVHASPGGPWAQGMQHGASFQQQQQQRQQLGDAEPVADGLHSSHKSLFATSVSTQQHQQQQQQQPWLSAPLAAAPRQQGQPTGVGLGYGHVGTTNNSSSSTAVTGSPGASMHSVRVSTASAGTAAGAVLGAGASPGRGSPRRLRLPLTGGVLDVYPDAVEVHSRQGSPILIDVLPCGGYDT